MKELNDNDIDKAYALMDKHGLSDWRLVIGDLPEKPDNNLWGYCNFTRKWILIDLSCPKRQFWQVLKHEIAHALRDEPGHDKEWEDIALSVGCSLPHVLRYTFTRWKQQQMR